jgi:predicted phosphate transport protein (TIGR00153 family)
MLGLFQMLMPKEGRFYILFNQHAQTLVAGAKALSDVLEGGDAVEPAVARVIAHEDEADAITAEVMLAVRRTFITPFDRIDIQDLVSSLDDAIDQMQKTAKAISLFEVRSFEPGMREMAKIIVAAADLTVEMVGLLPQMSKNAARLHELAQRMTEIEGQADALYDAGRKALFLAQKGPSSKDGGGDPMAFIVGVDIYSHLEKVVDRFEDVANRISGIVIEQV